MNETEVKKFFDRLKVETKNSGINQYPVDIVELGAEIGFNEQLSLQIADYLVKAGHAEYKAIGNTMIQLR